MPAADQPSAVATGHSTGALLPEWMDAQYRLSAAAMLRSVSAVHLVKQRPGFGQTIRPARGSVLASPSIASYDPDPDYFFHWLRDSAIVIDAARILIEEGAGDSGIAERVRDFVRFSLALRDLDGRVLLSRGAVGAAVSPDFLQYVRSEDELRAAVGDRLLGETRFNPDGTLDIIKWARPQHDGPALRALTVMRLGRLGVFDDAEIRDAARGLLEADLAFTHRRWREPSFDIWEERGGHHYYTRLVQFAALCDGAQWMDEAGDSSRARACRAASREIAARLDGHWVAAKGFYSSRVGEADGEAEKELDIATILAVNHAGREEGPHSALDPKAQATLARLENLFAADYPINQSLPPGRGAAMGRYEGDRYYSGGAYYFATLGAAEFFFRLAGAVARGAPTNEAARDRLSLPAVMVGTNQTLDRSVIFEALISRGDGFMATVRAYTPANGELAEQFDRATGRQTSSKDLAWSHAALITAVAARRAACRAGRKASPRA
ncbi:MAG: glycoside hydrolase family 15 protein [Roseiarcus sp.]